jgi:hypothetical protein
MRSPSAVESEIVENVKSMGGLVHGFDFAR